MSKNLSDIFPPTEIGGGGGGIEEAPKTGKMYARKDEAWAEFEAGDIEPGNKDGETLAWSTADAEWMPNDTLIAKNARVGIGTSDPDVDLHIYRSTPIIKMEHVGNNSSRFYFESTTDGAWGSILASNESGNRRLAFSPNNGTGDARYGGITLHTDKAEIGGAFATNYGLHVHGNVGIGTDDPPAETLTVQGPILSNRANYASNQDQAYLIAAAKNYDGSTTNWGTHGYQHRLKTNSTGGSRITIDTKNGEMWSMGGEGKTTFAGTVGIGMTPLVRDAKEQLAEWSGWIDAKLELEPSLDRKAATLDVTDGAFEVLPTEDKLAEWMETRGAGDQLQVGGQGNISATGMVRADKPSEFGKPSDMWSNAGWYGVADVGGLYTGGGYAVTLASNGYRNKSGTWTSLNANGKTGAAEIILRPEGAIEFRQDAVKADGSASVPNLRSTFSANGDATFTETVRAKKFVGDGSGLTNLPGGSGGGGSYIAGEGIDINNTANTIAMSGSYNGDFTVGGTVDAGAGNFSGTVNASKVYTNTAHRPGHSGVNFGANYWAPTNSAEAEVSGTVSLGTSSIKFNEVHAVKYYGDGSALTGLSTSGDYVPLTGNSTVAGTITATDFIATSDERLKDNITPIPVGLIDDIKPVSWDWKDGGKSAGVVAQQLQAIGLDDYVHENDDGQLGVNYQALTAILLAEVIDLKRRLAE